MERLLKIVEGPMRGAEIALVAGTRVKVGSGEACDIVIADASLAETAFELDVAESAVTLVGPDGTAREMRPFEVQAFGTTSFALGPAEGRWEELRPAERNASSEPSSAPAELAPEAEAASPSASDETPEKASDGTDAARRTSRRGAIGCLAAVLLVLAALALAWFFRHAIIARVPRLKPWVERIDGCDARKAERATVKERAEASLKDLAAQHGLSYEERDGVPVLAGNFRQRTERLAMRALALAADRRCRLDLSDDETLASSAEALLFMVTEGALKLSAASNRAVVVTGFAPSAAALGAVRKALLEDVPWVAEIDVKSVKVGGPVPAGQKESAFAVSGVLSGTAAEAAKTEGAETPDIRISDVSGRKLPRNLFPVAGILTRPYPCVVLRDGHRIVEGGQLGTYTVERIGADALELKPVAGGKAEWTP